MSYITPEGCRRSKRSYDNKEPSPNFLNKLFREETSTSSDMELDQEGDTSDNSGDNQDNNNNNNNNNEDNNNNLIMDDQPRYQDWNRQRSVKILMHAQWYTVDELMTNMNYIRTINFSITEQRSQALARLNGMFSRCPYSQNQRFPDDLDFVCESVGDWARKFQQLRSSLSYKDSKTGAPDHVHKNDSFTAFWNATTAIIGQLMSLDGVINRTDFEEKYQLRWA